jgi:phenylalanyl-tRNA synthetase alpha chain
MMLNEIEQIRQEALREFQEAKTFQDAEATKFKFLARKGLIADLFRQMPQLPEEERPEAGQALNRLRAELEGIAEEKLAKFAQKREAARIDTTLPGRKPHIGALHPLTLVTRHIVDIFRQMGFAVARGPEIETVYYNFDALNTPPWHPSRDESATLYLPNGFVLRTETSPVQIRVMESMQPPVRVIVPGRVYRRDKPDATHSPMFHQVEGLYVDVGVTMADLKGTLVAFYRTLFGEDTGVRFRPHFFPFTEPSAEVDITCLFCAGKGCRVCKGTGWIEMGGSGMVDPNVLDGVGYDSEKYTGWACGLGIERVAMFLYGIENIRTLYDADVRFLRQFI